MTVNERIKRVRTYLKLSQAEFSSALDLSRNYISLVETGDRTPSERTLITIADRFGISLDWLRDEVGEMVTAADDDDLELIRKKFSMDDFSFSILKNYFKLSLSERETFASFLMDLFLDGHDIPKTVPFYGRLASAGYGQIVFDERATVFCNVPKGEKYKNAIYAIEVNGANYQAW